LPSVFWNCLNPFRRLANAKARLLMNEERIAALETRLAAMEARGVVVERAQAAAQARMAQIEGEQAAAAAQIGAFEDRITSDKAAVLVRFGALEGETGSHEAAMLARFGALEGQARSREAAMLARFGALEGQARSREAAMLARMDAVQYSLDAQERQLAVRAFMDWISHLPPRNAPLVSVILPTRDRAELLPRAVASVLAQTHPNWELLIVDDGSEDDTGAVIDGLTDPRIRCFRAPGAGVCAARNLGLRQAQGALIAYLDDDNVMHPDWLKSVVWGFEQRAQGDVLYGAFIVDDTARIDGKGCGDLPKLYFWPYDHQAVAQHNIADIGCIAHRARLPQAHFDESLREMGDWDLFLRLTREAPPLGLPAIACFYTTDAPHRLSHGHTFDADLAFVREKNRR
jgi:hypothetical protein